jgi:hypothetical protein
MKTLLSNSELATITDRDLATLLVNDQKVELSGGRFVRLVIEHDDEYSIADDGDWFGKVESTWRFSGRAHQPRPEGFDGSARKIHVGGDTYWWQPPTDVLGDKDALRKLTTAVHDALLHGYFIVKVEAWNGTDAYGRPVITDYATLGAVDFNTAYAITGDDTGYLRDIVADLLADIGK